MTHLIVINKAFLDRLSIVFVVVVFIRNLFVIKDEFSDLDVGTVKRVHLSARRKIQGNSEWTLKKVIFLAENYNVLFVLTSGMIAYHLSHLFTNLIIYHFSLLILIQT